MVCKWAKPKHYIHVHNDLPSCCVSKPSADPIAHHNELFYLSEWLFCVMRPHLITSCTNESMTLFKGPLLTPLDPNLLRGIVTACWRQLLRKSTSEKTPHLRIEWVIMTSAAKNDSTSNQSPFFLQVLQWGY